MRVHTYGPTCPGCVGKLYTAHPYLREWFKNDVKPFWNECHISWAFRGEADQNRVFSEKKSKARWPNSDHNNMKDGKPCSLALDLFFLDNDNVATWNPRIFYDINQNNIKNHSGIYWGGAWKTFKDPDHFGLKYEFI